MFGAAGRCANQTIRLLTLPFSRLGPQRGYMLPMTIMVLMVAVLVAVPVTVLVGNLFMQQGKIEDSTRAYYAADAAIQAVIEDLVRGADSSPLPPNTYTPPSVGFGEIIPSVTVEVKESQTLSTVKPVEFKVSGNINLIQGFNPQGSATNLAEDDTAYYEVTGSGDPPVVIWEATGEVITFPEVSFGEVFFIAKSSKSYTKVELFVFNPDDPLHTLAGYNPVPDVTEILDLADTEETITFTLEDADIQYLNSLGTKTLKVKVGATRTGGFRLSSDQLVFSMAGTITSDTRQVDGEPTILTGTFDSGSGNDLDTDDTNYYTLRSSGNIVEFETKSDPFIFTTIDTASVAYVVRSNISGVTIELYVYNPTDPAHTNGGYDPLPDLSATIPATNLDKTVSLAVTDADVSYLNSLAQEQRALRLKVRATASTAFKLISDQLVFLTTSMDAPTEVLRQIVQQYVDPGLRNTAMATMAPKEGYLLRLYNVRSGMISVNWAYHTPDYSQVRPSVTIFRGFAIDNGAAVTPGKLTSKIPSRDNEVIISTSARPGQSFVRTKSVSTEEGVYSIMFFNDSAKTVITEPFFATGSSEDTWIYVAAFKDYLVTSTAEKVQIKAVLRQVPGPSEPPDFPWSTTNINWITNLVTVQSWEPSGIESLP